MGAAFAYTVKGRAVFGDKAVVWGTFTNSGGATGGDILTGLRRVEMLHTHKTGSAVDASQYAINETMPRDASDVTIVTTADVSGTWWAIGNY